MKHNFVAFNADASFLTNYRNFIMACLVLGIRRVPSASFASEWGPIDFDPTEPSEVANARTLLNSFKLTAMKANYNKPENKTIKNATHWDSYVDFIIDLEDCCKDYMTD